MVYVNENELLEKSAKLPKGLVVGKIVRFQVADNYAFYKIVKIKPKNTKLKWIDIGDGYVEEVLGKNGVMPTDRLRVIVERDERIAELFKKDEE